MVIDDNSIKKLLVSLAVEKSLIDVTPNLYTKVSDMLSEKYDAEIADTYDHPEYLKNVLKEVYGDAADALVDSIHEKLEEFSSHPKISKFLEAIKQ